MIDPGVAVVDVDPEGFALVNAALSSRQRTEPATATVVVDGPEGLAALGDLEALRQAEGVDRLVVLDRQRLDDLSAAFVEAARETDDQGRLLAKCREIYVNHPAVTLVPCPSDAASGWVPVGDLLESIEDGHWIRAVIGDWGLAAELCGGRIVRITSSPPEGAVSAVLLQGTADDLEAVLCAPNPIGELLHRIDSGLVALDVREGVRWLG